MYVTKYKQKLNIQNSNVFSLKFNQKYLIFKHILLIFY